MNVDTISMPRHKAAQAHREYCEAVRRNNAKREEERKKRAKIAGQELHAVRIEKTQLEKEDEELKQLYHTLSKGEKVISLPQVFRKSGLNKELLPLFAIAPSAEQFVRFTNDRWGGPQFYWGSNSRHQRIRLPRETFPAESWNEDWRRTNKLIDYPVRAVVPSIPARFRPDNLDGYFTLWEAVWEKAPPIDPILLKRVTPTTYVVVAQWDLTPAEQMILEGRFT